MKLLATLKGERYELPHHTYGVLTEIDGQTRRVLRSVQFPAPSVRTPSHFMAPLTGGLCRLGERIFVALWNCVVEVDYATFQVVNCASSPWMADLHGMACDGRHLYVVATATECLLCLDPDTLAPLWRWGPGEEILGRHAPPLPFWKRWQRLPWTPAQEAEDHRLIHKSRSPFYRHHLNDVRWHDGQLWLTTKGWFGRPASSAVIRLDPASREASFLVPPGGGGLGGIHDGEFYQGDLFVTASESNSVARIDPHGRVRHHPLEPAGYFVRGLCRTGGLFWVGLTRLRCKGDTPPTPSWVMAYDEAWEKPVVQMEMAGFYPEEVGAAIHALLPSPGEGPPCG